MLLVLMHAACCCCGCCANGRGGMSHGVFFFVSFFRSLANIAAFFCLWQAGHCWPPPPGGGGRGEGSPSAVMAGLVMAWLGRARHFVCLVPPCPLPPPITQQMSLPARPGLRWGGYTYL